MGQTDDDMNFDVDDLARSIQAAQKRKGWTNEQTADAAGLPVRTYCFYKNGEVQHPSPDKLRRIAAALDLSDLLASLSAELADVLSIGDEKYVRLHEVAIVSEADGTYALQRTDRVLPMAFEREFVRENIALDTEEVMGYEVTGATSSQRYYPGQHLVIVGTAGRVPCGDDYLVRIGASWDLYAVQSLPEGMVRFHPHNDTYDAFELPLDDSARVDDATVEIVGRVAWESRMH
jgi:transcriptional regulator with XRE-family HTH domain